MVNNSKKAFLFLLSMVICFVMFGVFPEITNQINIITSKAAGIDNITARADYLYNLTWTAQANMNGYINSSGKVTKTYAKGQSYRIPYGQPVGSNGFIGYNISIDNFLEATKSASNPFYTKRGGGTSGSMNSNYYSMDCSTFVSYCWGLSSRYTTSTWSSVNATNLGKCTSVNVGKIQQGDAINLAGNHIVLVSRVNSNGTYEITEETPPEIKRITYSASDLVKKYSSYTIYRYNKRDSVAPPPNATSSSFPGEENNSYSVPISVTASKRINTYDGNGNQESNRYIDAGDACTIDKVYKNGFVHIGYPTSSGTRWAYAKKDDFDINSSTEADEFFDFWGVDDGIAIGDEYKVWMKQVGLGDSSNSDVNLYIDGKKTENYLSTLKQDDDGYFSYNINTIPYSKGIHTLYAVFRNTNGKEIWVSRKINIDSDNFFNFWGVDNFITISGFYKIWLKQVGLGNVSNSKVTLYLDELSDFGKIDTIYQDEDGFFAYNLDTAKYNNGNHIMFAILKNTSGKEICVTRTLNFKNDTKRFDIFFDTNGGSLSIFNMTVIYDEPYGILPAPMKKGYTFVGWYTAVIGGTKITSDTKVDITANQTLYAQWKANSYTVTLNADGGNCDKKNISVTYDSKYGTLPSPVKKGYTFTGWYTAETGGTEITADSKVSITANQTLYAQYKAEVVKGDVNNDGEFSIADVVLLQKWLLGVSDIKLDNWKSADLCEDSRLDVFDLCLMKKMLINS